MLKEIIQKVSVRNSFHPATSTIAHLTHSHLTGPHHEYKTASLTTPSFCHLISRLRIHESFTPVCSFQINQAHVVPEPPGSKVNLLSSLLTSSLSFPDIDSQSVLLHVSCSPNKDCLTTKAVADRTCERRCALSGKKWNP